MFKIGDKVRITSVLETYYDWAGYVEDTYTLYSSKYCRDVLMYNVLFEYSYICDGCTDVISISRKFSEDQLEFDKEWLRDQKLKSLGL